MAQVREILKRVRTQILDDLPAEYMGSGYDWVTDDADLLWSNEDLVLYLDEAMIEFCQRRPIHDASNSEVTQVAVSAGTLVDFALDDRIMEVESVQLQSRADADKEPLFKKFQRELDRDLPEWRTYDKAVEMYLEDLDDNQITLIGKLSDDDTVLMSVTRRPLKQLYNVQWPFNAWEADTAYVLDDIVHAVDYDNDHWFKVTTPGTSDATEPTWDVSGGTTSDGTVVWTDQGQIGAFELPEINYRHHLLDLPLYVAHKAYLKQDSETKDIERSNYFFQRFENEAGPKLSAYAQARKRRLSNYRGRIREYYR